MCFSPHRISLSRPQSKKRVYQAAWQNNEFSFWTPHHLTTLEMVCHLCFLWTLHGQTWTWTGSVDSPSLPHSGWILLLFLQVIHQGGWAPAYPDTPPNTLPTAVQMVASIFIFWRGCDLLSQQCPLRPPTPFLYHRPMVAVKPIKKMQNSQFLVCPLLL